MQFVKVLVLFFIFSNMAVAKDRCGLLCGPGSGKRDHAQKEEVKVHVALSASLGQQESLGAQANATSSVNSSESPPQNANTEQGATRSEAAPADRPAHNDDSRDNENRFDSEYWDDRHSEARERWSRRLDYLDIELVDLSQQALLGVPEAQYMIGLAYLNGEQGVAENKEKAIYWFEKAAQAGHHLALTRWLSAISIH